MNQNGYNPQGVPGYGFQSAPPQGEYSGQDYEYQTGPQNYPAGQQRYFQTQNSGSVQPAAYAGYQAPTGQGYGYQNSGAYQPSAAQQPVSYQGGQQGYGQGIQQGYMQGGYPGYTQPGMQNYPAQGQSVPYGYGGTASGAAGGGYNPPGQMSGAYNPSPQQGTPTGSFIPPTPYSAGYTSPGYQPMNTSMQGYPPYGQMGRNQPGYRQPDFSQQIPLNGGGYVPPKVSVRRNGFELKPLYLILAGGLLLVLFGLGLLLPSTALKIVFLLLTIGSTAFLWVVRSLTTDNRRLCYTIIAAVLCLAVAISFIPWKNTTQTDGRNPDSGNSGNPVQTDSSKVSGVTGETVTAKPASPETTDTPEPEDNYLLERLYTFFKYWSGNRQDEMLGLCAPSWQNKQENPRTALFTILANRKPIDMSMETITGTSADLSRKVILVTTLDRNNLKPAEKYRMTILMVKENNDWYIMPESLATFDPLETPDPNLTPAVSPTPTAAIYSNTVLYYNPDGGEYYHFDPYCINVKKSLTPLAGQFYYSQVDDPPYDKLKPCNVCGAPLRPSGP